MINLKEELKKMDGNKLRELYFINKSKMMKSDNLKETLAIGNRVDKIEDAIYEKYGYRI